MKQATKGGDTINDNNLGCASSQAQSEDVPLEKTRLLRDSIWCEKLREIRAKVGLFDLADVHF